MRSECEDDPATNLMPIDDQLRLFDALRAMKGTGLSSIDLPPESPATAGGYQVAARSSILLPHWIELARDPPPPDAKLDWLNA